MYTDRSARIRKLLLRFMLMGIVLSLLSASGSPTVHAQDVGTPQTTEQPAVRTLPLSDQPLIEEHVINGSPVPPPGFETERQSVEVFPSSAIIIENVPTYTWSLGCSAGGGGIVAAFNDRSHPNIFEGEMPLDDSSMSTITDVNGDTYKLNPSVASQATFTDYWIEYRSPLPDPYTGFGPGGSVSSPRPVGDDLSSQSAGWQQHAWVNAIGDFMYTSQSAFGNIDGSTKFYTYENSASPFTWEEMSSNSKPDGTLGMRLFYETRGYAVGESYNQLTDNVVTGGFSLAQYKAEINAGRPVILHLGSQPNEPGHTVVGVGYDTASNTIYIHNGWDFATHTMTWGGKYPPDDIPVPGMPLQMVSIVNIVPGTPSTYTISGNVGVANATIAYTSGHTTSDANGNYSFTVVSGWFGTVTPSKTGFTFTPADRFYANMTSNVVAQNYNNVNLLQDASFENGTSTNEYWVGTSTNFGTPLCDVNCIGEVFARTGSIWAWFGGVNVNETAALSQSVTIPNASSASLDFYLWIPDARAGSDAADVFKVKVDGATVFIANATQIKYYSVYRPINVNISAYANGAPHEIEFSAVTTGQVVSFLLDDVSLTSTPALYTISGDAGVGGVTLSYVDGTLKTVIADGNGDYSFTVPLGWSGTVTPYKSGYTFTLVSKTYSHVLSDQTSQNYTATVCIGCADVQVPMGGNPMGGYTLASGQERRENYPVSAGPVVVHSTNAVDLASAIRLQSYADNTLYSFVETMGVPSGLLSYKYYFPTYNNTWAPLNSQLRFANINDTDLEVKVTIGDTSWTYPVAAHSERRESLAVSRGPVIIESLDPAKKIIAAIRLQSYANNTLYSFAETLGIPVEQLSNTYYFPTYNNIWTPLNSQLRFANINDTDLEVKVTIGTSSWTYPVAAHSERREYLAVSGGPVIIESLDPAKKIIAAIRLQSFANNSLYSFAETLGIPVEQLSDTYYFPTYNNTWAPLNSQLRFGMP